MKKLLVFLLGTLLLGVTMTSCVSANGLTRYEYVRTVRSQIFQANGNDSVPGQMGRLGYNQATRAQIVKASVAADTVKFFPCLLINSKIGRNEMATFYFSSRYVKDVAKSFSLRPESEMIVSLPAGEYVVRVVSSNFDETYISHVDPRVTHTTNNNGKDRTFYLIAEKKLSNY